VSDPSGPIRLQRYLAQAGVASRRRCEEVIVAGRVRVNGKVITELGTRVRPGRDRVEVDGRRVWPEDLAYLLLHKPPGYVTTLNDPEGRPSVRDLLPIDGPRLFPVGRLDFNSEGALLCTNDGELAHALAHPSHQVPKRYLARVHGEVDDATLERLSKGVELDDGRTGPAKVLVQAETASHTWLEFTVTEGRNRLIRRMCEACELPVMRLIRTHFAGVEVEPLRPGAYRSLTPREVARLRKMAGLSPRKVQPRKPRRGSGGKGGPAGRGKPRGAGGKGGKGGAGGKDAPTGRGAGGKGASVEREKGGKGPPAGRGKGRPSGPGRSRGEGEGAAARGKGGEPRPPRKGDKARPQKSDDEGRPRRKGDEGRPRRKGNEGRPRRKGNEGRPRRKDNEGRPRRKDNEGPPRRKDDEGRPRRKDDEGRPRRKGDEGRSWKKGKGQGKGRGGPPGHR